MKKIAFVLYAKQLMSVTYLGGLPTTKPLEKALKGALGEYYEITFQWEQALEEEDLDAIVVPKPFPPVLNKEKVPEIHIPANLFLSQDTKKIKEKIDIYFSSGS